MRQSAVKSLWPDPELDRALDFFRGSFKLEEDLGFYTWDRSCVPVVPDSSRSCQGDVEVEELRCGLGAEEGPPISWHLPDAHPAQLKLPAHWRPMTLPLSSSQLTPRKRLQDLPPLVASVFVGSSRYDLSKVDFVCGGPILYTLATGDFDGRHFTVQRWRNVVIISSDDASPLARSGGGLQFERLLTGKSVAESDESEPHVEHLQVLRFGNYTALFAAEVEAMDDRGRPVEFHMRTRFPSWAKVMFRMLSSGSMTLYSGEVNGNVVERVEGLSLLDVMNNTTPIARMRFARRIVRAFKSIQAEVFAAGVPEQTPFNLTDLDRRGDSLLEQLEHDSSLLPKAQVLEELFSTGSDPLAEPDLVRVAEPRPREGMDSE